MKLTFSFTVVLLIVSAGILFSTGSSATDHREVYLLEAPPNLPFNVWRQGLEEKGVTLAHAFPPAGGLVIIDEEYNPELLSLEESLGVRVYGESPSGADEERIRSTTEGNILWNAQRRLMGLDITCHEKDMPPGSPLIHDALAPPPAEGEFLGACSSTTWKYSGSEYLLGNVSVNIILPESNGNTDPSTENWTAGMETNVSNEITEGLNEGEQVIIQSSTASTATSPGGVPGIGGIRIPGR